LADVFFSAQIRVAPFGPGSGGVLVLRFQAQKVEENRSLRDARELPERYIFMLALFFMGVVTPPVLTKIFQSGGLRSTVLCASYEWPPFTFLLPYSMRSGRNQIDSAIKKNNHILLDHRGNRRLCVSFSF
jgi:hypothetical protein